MKKYVILCICMVLFSGIFALLGSEVSSAVAAMSRWEQPLTLVIDAGHGGEDGGAVSPRGTVESGLNLEIASRLNLLLRFLGLHTKMIRTDDTAVYTEGTTIAQRKVSDIRNRVAITEATANALLVSIHQNKFPQEQYRGAQVFYARGSEALAQRLQDGLRTQLDPNNHREIKPARDIYLMEYVSCPALLIECGFLSNPQEELQLQDAAYQKKLASVLACILQCYTEESNEV